MKTFVLLSFLALVINNAYCCYIDPKPTFINTEFEVSIKSISPKTSSSRDGSIIIQITGGLPPYTTLVSGTTFPAETFQKDKISLSNLDEGSFTIIVQDQNKKIISKNIEIKVQ